MNVERTFDLLDRYREKFIDKDDALCGKQNGVWVKYSSGDYIDYSYNFCYGLLELGIKKGDKIITVSNNRPEWNFADLGMSMIGVIHVPVFASLSISDYHYVIDHSEASMIIVADKKLLKNVSPAVALSGKNIPVYSFDEIEGTKYWKEIIEAGKNSSGRHKDTVEKIKSSILPSRFCFTYLHLRNHRQGKRRYAYAQEHGKQFPFCCRCL